MRRQLEQMQIGSKLNTLDAGAQRAEVNRALQGAIAGNAAAKSDLDGLIAERDAYVQQTQGRDRAAADANRDASCPTRWNSRTRPVCGATWSTCAPTATPSC